MYFKPVVDQGKESQWNINNIKNNNNNRGKFHSAILQNKIFQLNRFLCTGVNADIGVANDDLWVATITFCVAFCSAIQGKQSQKYDILVEHISVLGELSMTFTNKIQVIYKLAQPFETTSNIVKTGKIWESSVVKMS